MFRPERMSLLQIVVLDDDLVAACAALARQKVLHLVDRAVVAPALREGTPAFFADTHAALEALLAKLDSTLDWLEDQLPDFPDCSLHPPLSLDPPRALEELAPLYAACADTLARLRTDHDTARAEIARLTRIADVLQSFESAGVTYQELAGFRYFACMAGVMPMRYVHAVRASLQQAPYHLELRRLGEQDCSVIVLCPKDVAGSVRNALRSVYFSEIAIPDEFQGDAHQALDEIEVRLWTLREHLAQVTRALRAACLEAAPRVVAWRKAVRANLKILEAMQLFGKTARTTFINGWVPRHEAPRVVTALQRLLQERVLIEITEPETADSIAHELVRRRALRVPTKFRHPLFLKAFEGLVTTYGIPDYDGIDPTFFVAVTFLLMFGMMFGDVGQGTCLVLCGALLTRARTVPKLRPAGALLVAVGISAMVFGCLFGSVFGFEHVLPALWIMPMEHVPTMLVTALVLGASMLSLGIVLNIIQAVARRNLKEAWFGQWGLISGMFYWLALGIFYLTVVRDVDIPVVPALLVLFIPIVLVVIGDYFYARLFGRGAAPTAEAHDEGGDHSLAELLFKPVEITLNLATHTISFVRVGAFGLNHAALMMVVFMLAKMGGSFSGPDATFATKTSYVIAVVTGNIFVMMMEGMVVFIQCLRLEYYEFFSKFFAGDGIRYQPLEVEE
jgi:V/A-type H+-transporting ATPase subunit I